jgi:PAS domain S-box-containing protein
MHNPNELTDSARLKEVLNGIEEVIILTYLTGEIYFVNSAFEKVFEITMKEAIGKKLIELIPTEKKKIKLIELRALKGGQGSDFEYEIKSKNSIKWVSHSWKILTINNEKIIANIIRDITSQTKMQEKLIENEEKYRKIFELSSEVILILDTKGIVLDINKRTEDWINYSKKEIIGKHILKLPFIAIESKALILEKFAERITGKKVKPYEAKFISKEKEIKIGRIAGTAIKNDEEKIIKTLIIISDITDEKKQEEELRKTKEIYESIFNNANDLIQRCDEKGKIIDVNKKWIEVMGYSKKEAIELSLNKLIDSSHLTKCMQEFQKVLKGQQISNIKTVFVSKKGKKIELEVNASPLKDKNEKIISTIGIFRLIKEPKKFNLF